MLSILAALLGVSVSVSPCTPVPGADRLWQPQTRWVIVGEQHGTTEIPLAFANLACLAAATGRPVTVAVEYSSDWQARIDEYLASDGGRAAELFFLRLPSWTQKNQDGRGSVAMLRLFKQLRQMKQAGQIQGVVATDFSWYGAPSTDPEEEMFNNWVTIPGPDNALVLALVGDAHVARPSSAGASAAGARMPAGRTVTVRVVGNGGKAWSCAWDGCRAHAVGHRHRATTGIADALEPGTGWNAIYELGEPFTAALPAEALEAPDEPIGF